MDQMFRLHFHHIRQHRSQMLRLRILHIRHSDFAFIWIRCSNFIYITFASSADQTFRPRLLRIRRSDFAFIWIRCSDFICITFASTAVRRSDFVFCISGIQTLPSYGSDVQTSSASHSLAQQIRRLNFVFSISGVQTSPLYGSNVQTSSASHSLALQSDVQTSSSAYQVFRLRLYMD